METNGTRLAPKTTEDILAESGSLCNVQASTLKTRTAS
jgi:hypothetical protein